ncbi:MAG TPA: DUF1801 domain-containing protein [Fimbriimonadaceae bacterium]|nr:DUF1801 domain-containing protein [Fimbriimonadaceae bacterium]
MATPAFASVDDYLASMPPDRHPILTAVRQAIRAALPEADECITYNVPTYKVDGKAVIYFGGWKNHYAIYPASDALIEAFGDEMAPFKVAKNTLQAPYTKPVDSELVRRLAEFRALEVAHKPKRR